MPSSNEGSSKRQAGEASAFADRRGGPANFAGVDFQVNYAIWNILCWLQEHLTDLTATGFVRCEARILVEGPSPDLTVGQHGFDVAVTDRGQQPDEFRELKRAPTLDEVIDLLATLQHLPSGAVHEAGTPVRNVGLVSEGAPPVFRRLERLHRLSKESTTDNDLRTLVAAANVGDMTRMLDALGPTPKATMNAMAAPEQWPETLLQANVVRVANTLAGGPAASVRLVDRLRSVVTTASAQRESIHLPQLRTELLADGLLLASHAASPPQDPELAEILFVLEACPVPLPKLILSRATGRSVDELDTMLGDLVSGGVVIESENGWHRTPPPDAPTSSQFGGNLAAEVLASLVAWAENVKVEAANQTLNAYALGVKVAGEEPELVGKLFKVFDKPSKRWGDLNVVWDLANLSDRCLLDVLQSPLSNDERHKWAKVRAQTYICGQGWVLQRVNDLDEALIFMKSAKTISESNHDDENQAFTLKCGGRLERMLAERLGVDDPDRADLLRASIDNLTEAEGAFEALIPSDARFETDRGECVSLLARTLATALELDAADEVAARAEGLLAGKTTDKAYADVKILRAEICLAKLQARDSNDPELVHHRAEQRAILAQLLSDHERPGSHGPGGDVDRGSSEIVARLNCLLARLVDNPDEIGSHLEAAAEIYSKLRYRPGLEDVEWNRKQLGADIPLGLMQALDDAGAEPGVRLIALDLALEWTSTLSVPTSTLKTISQAADAESWRDIVDEARSQHDAMHVSWSDGRSA